MLPILGIPMIEYVFEWLGLHGIDEAVLSLGYLPDRFVEAYPGGVIAGIKVTYAVEDEPLDTAGAIRFAANFANVNETFIVVNGDVLTDLNLTKLLEFHRSRRAEATIALHPVDDPSRFGVVPTTPSGKVISFVEKPTREEAPTNLINAGTYVFEPSVLERIARTGRVSVERETFPTLATAGTLYAMPDQGYWLDAGTPLAFIEANTLMAKLRRGEQTFNNFPDGSWVHPMSSVDPSSAIIGSVIDRSCDIGANVVLRNVVLLPGVEVQDGARVSSSIIGDGAVIGRLSNLGPTCVVGANVQVGSRSELSGDVRLRY
jgi:mannose-1-phosphate guanylyltransferase